MNCTTCGDSGIVRTEYTDNGESFVSDDPCFMCRPMQWVMTERQAQIDAMAEYCDTWRERKEWYKQYDEAERMSHDHGAA